MSAEVLDKQVRRRDDGREEPDENDGRHPDGPERSRDADGCVLLEFVGR